MNRVTVRSSTIFIATGEETKVFRSVDEIPPALRKRLEESTNSLNSATILIADRGGREEIVRSIRGFPLNVRSRLADSVVERQAEATIAPGRLETFLRQCSNLALPSTIGIIVWLLLSLRHS